MFETCWSYLVVLTVGLLLPPAAWAYIDPGTGVAVIGSLGPLIVGVAVAVLLVLLRIFWKPILRLLGLRKDSDIDD